MTGVGGEWGEYGQPGGRGDKGAHRGKGGAKGGMSGGDHHGPGATNNNNPFITNSTGGTGASGGGVGVGVPVKKVTQWVQCERVNCKKWRKVISH